MFQAGGRVFCCERIPSQTHRLAFCHAFRPPPPPVLSLFFPF